MGGPGRAREAMEARFGPLGRGLPELTVAGRAYRLSELLDRLGLAFEGCRTIDGFALGADHFAVRYYDPEEQRIVVYEFDAELRHRRETRVHVAEWIGEEGLALGDVPGESERSWTWS
jgi:hypothetical protein